MNYQLPHPSMPTRAQPYTEGRVNPVERPTTTRVVNVDTLFRPNYDTTKSTDFVFQLPEVLDQVVRMRLRAIEPLVPYAFVAGNNLLEFVVDEVSTLVTVPPGNYTSAEFYETVQDLLPAGVDLSFNRVGQTVFTGTFDLLFPVDGCPNAPLGAGWYLGFRKPAYAVDGTLTSEGTYGRVPYLFLDIDDYSHNHQTNTLLSPNTLSLAAKPSPSACGSFLGNTLFARITSDQDTEYQRQYFGPIRVEKLRIRLLDRFGRVVDAHNDDYSLALEFESLYT